MSTNIDLSTFDSKDDAIQALVDEGVKVKEAIKMVESSGLFTRSRIDQLPLMVKMFRELDGENRKVVVKKVSDATGYSLSTTNHFFNAINFAKEWARQES